MTEKNISAPAFFSVFIESHDPRKNIMTTEPLPSADENGEMRLKALEKANQ